MRVGQYCHGRGPRELSSPFTTGGYNDKPALRRGPHWPGWHCDLGLPPSSTVSNKFLFMSHPICSNLSGLRQWERVFQEEGRALAKAGSQDTTQGWHGGELEEKSALRGAQLRHPGPLSTESCRWYKEVCTFLQGGRNSQRCQMGTVAKLIFDFRMITLEEELEYSEIRGWKACRCWCYISLFYKVEITTL